MCFEDYKPDKWDYSGPRAVWRTLMKVCNKTKVWQMRPEFCWGFKICPSTVFFPFGWYTDSFDTNPKTIQNSMNKLKNDTIAIHLWSSNSRDKPILKAKPNLYTIYAEKMCPKAYGASGEYFN